jgi:PBP1b-binding outer membrane lipoprotein LpoB
MKTCTLLSTASLLLTALILPGCSEQSPEQAADQAGEPIDLPASPEQLEKLERVVERFPEVASIADQARADGTITEQDIIDVLTAAEKAKAARVGQ